MKYVKQHFVTGMKVSLPDVLNRMEDGIAAACAAALEGVGTVSAGEEPAASIRGGRLNLTLPRGPQGEPGPQGDPGEGLSDSAKTLLLSLLAGETEDRGAALKALREEWGVADRSTDTETAAAERGLEDGAGNYKHQRPPYHDHDHRPRRGQRAGHR